MKEGRAKHLIVVSYDAFSEDHWERAAGLPNLSSLIRGGAYTHELKSVYPTLTYVVHTTMVTGVYPDRHGIYHNNPFQPFIEEKNQEWFWFERMIKVRTLYDALRERNMKSAGLLWPVTGKAPIDYNIPEIRAIKKENQALKVLANGSPLFSLKMEKRYGHLRKGIEQPYLDDFTAECAADVIKEKHPNLLLMHLIDLDDAKHTHGTDGPEIDEVLLRMDKRLGELIRAVREAGIAEDTVFMIIGDHGQLNIRYRVRLNRLLQEAGLIDPEKRSWRAYVQSAGGAAYLHLKEGDSEAEEKALTILQHAMKEEKYGIEGVFGRKEQAHFPEASGARYLLEAKEGYCFIDDMDKEIVTDLSEKGIRYATHGFSPDKPGYQCNLVISGACIRENYPMGAVSMVEIAPTIAEILGLSLPDCDGSPINRIFRQEKRTEL
ncbi:MAG: alkaline phosphatase family protein [Lachnospiraceae bacterium]